MVVPPVQLRARTHGNWAREAVVLVDRAALGVHPGVLRKGLVDRSYANLRGLRLFDRWDLLVTVESIEGGDGKAVDDDGEDDEEVDDWDHGCDKVLFFLSLGLAWLGEKVTSVLDVEDGSDA